jgi:processive 1,2-diacylglycerol beta-glucosyltransferase
MIQLFDKDTGAKIGAITEEQLKFLIDELVEESDEDKDYYIDGPALEFLKGAGADQKLIGLLREALGDRSEMEVEWKRE